MIPLKLYLDYIAKYISKIRDNYGTVIKKPEKIRKMAKYSMKIG